MVALLNSIRHLAPTHAVVVGMAELFICGLLMGFYSGARGRSLRKAVLTLLAAVGMVFGICIVLRIQVAPAAFVFGPSVAVSYFVLDRFRRRETSDGLLVRPPGGWLRRLAAGVGRKSTSDLIDQMVADMRVEHFQALSDGSLIKAQWVTLLHYFSIARALSIDRLLSAALGYVIGTIRAGKP